MTNSEKDFEAILDKAEASFLSFLEWKDLMKLEMIASEVNLVSERWQCGGTPDAIVYLGEMKKRALLDLKTSNGCYPDYLCQLGAYESIWEENYPDQPITGGLHLLRISKEEAAFHHHMWNSLPEAVKAFQHALELHKIQKILKRMA